MRVLMSAILAAMAAGAVLSGQAAAADEAAARKAIGAAYTRLERAESTGDTEGVLALMAPDYAMKLPDGRVVTRKDMRVAWQRSSPRGRVKPILRIKKVVVRGAQAVAIVEAWAQVGVGATGSGHRLARVTSQRDTWVKTGGGWKLRSTEVLGRNTKKTGVGPAADLAAAILREVAATADRLQTLEARLRITQWTLRNGTAGSPDSVRVGSVRLMKPTFARIEIGAPGRQTVAADGRSLWLVDYQSGTYLKRSPADAGSIAVPQAEFVNCFFPVWARNIGQRPGVQTRYLGTEGDAGGGHRVVETQERRPDTESTITTKYYVGRSGLIERTVQDIQEGDRRFRLDARLTDIVTGRRLSSASFAYRPPPSVRPYGRPADDRDLLPVGTSAPRFTLPRPGGGTVSLSDALQQGKALIVNFWFYG